MVTKPPDCSQAVATHMELVIVVEVVMALTRIVPIARNVIMVCHQAECSLEVVNWVVGLSGLGPEVGRRSVGWVVGLLHFREGEWRRSLHGGSHSVPH